MSKHRILILAAGLFILAGVGLAWAQPAPEMDNYGFTHVLATVYLHPGQGASITVPDQYSTSSPAGYATITIPDNAFSVPVRFQVLAGPNKEFDKLVSKNQIVVANFAYEVTDLNTGKLIEKFDHPVMYSVKDTMITANSVYWAVTPTNPSKLVNVNKASVITKDTLEHPTPVASVGWIVTTPAIDLPMMTKK